MLDCTAPPCTYVSAHSCPQKRHARHLPALPTCSQLQEPTQPLCMPQAVHTHPYDLTLTTTSPQFLELTPPSCNLLSTPCTFLVP